MDNRQGPYTEQVNSVETIGNLNEGIAFATLIPPVSAMAIEPADVPVAWHPAANQRISTSLSGPDAVAALVLSAQSASRHAPNAGVVTVTNERWMPKNARAVPPSITNRLGMYLSAQWAMLYNSSSEARRNHRWAVVTSRGNVLVLTGIGLQARPVNPCDFPPCVTGGLSGGDAERMMIESNTPRCQFARVPREWTVALRRADSVEMEGGAAC